MIIRCRHCLTCKPHVKDEVLFVDKLIDIFDIARSEIAQWTNCDQQS